MALLSALAHLEALITTPGHQHRDSVPGLDVETRKIASATHFCIQIDRPGGQQVVDGAAHLFAGYLFALLGQHGDAVGVFGIAHQIAVHKRRGRGVRQFGHHVQARAGPPPQLVFIETRPPVRRPFEPGRRRLGKA